MKDNKTNVMRLLEKAGIKYEPHSYDPEIRDGSGVAEILGEDSARVFKTLVTVSPRRINYVFVIPVDETLDLKKAAACAGEKSVAMIKQKELLPLTGYIHGGCSPIGMKKKFRTFIHSSALNFETIYVSAGKVGFQAELSPKELSGFISAEFSELIV